jgi:serine acetyltransferase
MIRNGSKRMSTGARPPLSQKQNPAAREVRTTGFSRATLEAVAIFRLPAWLANQQIKRLEVFYD